MDGNSKKSFNWIALFRDGRTIEQSGLDNTPAALNELAEYLYGTKENPKPHYLLWFMVTDGDKKFIVSFDRDGDAYIKTPDERIIMTEFKIRSAKLLFHTDKDQDTHYVGFGGINTCGELDHRVIAIDNNGDYTLTSELPGECAIIII